jgi:hypothetical protein
MNSAQNAHRSPFAFWIVHVQILLGRRIWFVICFAAAIDLCHRDVYYSFSVAVLLLFCSEVGKRGAGMLIMMTSCWALTLFIAKTSNVSTLPSESHTSCVVNLNTAVTGKVYSHPAPLPLPGQDLKDYPLSSP